MPAFSIASSCAGDNEGNFEPISDSGRSKTRPSSSDNSEIPTTRPSPAIIESASASRATIVPAAPPSITDSTAAWPTATSPPFGRRIFGRPKSFAYGPSCPARTKRQICAALSDQRMIPCRGRRLLRGNIFLRDISCGTPEKIPASIFPINS